MPCVERYTTQWSHLSCLSSYSGWILVFIHTGRDCLLLTSTFCEHTAWFVFPHTAEESPMHASTQF